MIASSATRLATLLSTYAVCTAMLGPSPTHTDTSVGCTGDDVKRPCKPRTQPGSYIQVSTLIIQPKCNLLKMVGGVNDDNSPARGDSGVSR